MREKKIFLASSSELKEERKSFARFIREINEAMKQQNIELRENSGNLRIKLSRVNAFKICIMKH